MRLNVLLLFLLFFLSVRFAAAGEAREIELNDGSIITGDVQSLNNGVYTIKSDSLGILRIEASKIRAIRAKSSVPTGSTVTESSNTAGEAKNLQDRMTSDKDVMTLIQSLRNDPEVKKILEDPEIMRAIQEGNFAALETDPRIRNLLDNATVKEIEKKVK